MQSATQLAPASKTSLWAGRIVSALVVLFLLFDAGMKLLNLPPAVEGTAKLGYPASVVVPLGMVLLACVLLYIVPRTSILGAILLTGYLGGATATNVRVQNPWILFPVGIGVLVWAGLYLRDEGLRTLIPLRRA
jgi:hypothetical protein